MAIEDVKQIIEVNGVTRVNAYLKSGWVLLGKTTKYGDGDEYFMYSLGWTGDLPVKSPEV